VTEGQGADDTWRNALAVVGGLFLLWQALLAIGWIGDDDPKRSNIPAINSVGGQVPGFTGGDLDCVDFNGPVYIGSGPDPNRLDADNDGWGCE
jgi:hypothetical protein